MAISAKSILTISARVLLGLIFFVIGLNFFLQFLPPAPDPVGAEAAFAGGLYQAGYFFPLLMSIQVVAGALLLIGFFVPLVLVVLVPITIHIFLFHAMLSPDGVPMGVIVLALNLYLAWVYRDYYKRLFERKASLMS